MDLFSYFRGPFFLHPVNGPYFLVDVISVDFFSNRGRFFRGRFVRTPLSVWLKIHLFRASCKPITSS